LNLEDVFNELIENNKNPADFNITIENNIITVTPKPGYEGKYGLTN